jgi:hypothetical protein
VTADNAMCLISAKPSGGMMRRSILLKTLLILFSLTAIQHIAWAQVEDVTDSNQYGSSPELSSISLDGPLAEIYLELISNADDLMSVLGITHHQVRSQVQQMKQTFRRAFEESGSEKISRIMLVSAMQTAIESYLVAGNTLTSRQYEFLAQRATEVVNSQSRRGWSHRVVLPLSAATGVYVWILVGTATGIGGWLLPIAIVGTAVTAAYQLNHRYDKMTIQFEELRLPNDVLSDMGIVVP